MIDIIILLIIAGYTLYGFKKGLITATFNALSNIIAFVVALFGAKTFAATVSKTLITPIFGDIISKGLQNATDSSVLSNINLPENFANFVSLDGITATGDTLQTAVNQIVSGIAHNIAFAILFIIFFIAVNILLSFAKKTLNILTRAVFLGPLNILLGGALGFITGVLICVLVLTALKTFTPALFSDLGYLSPSNLQDSIVTQKLLELPNKFLN